MCKDMGAFASNVRATFEVPPPPPPLRTMPPMPPVPPPSSKCCMCMQTSSLWSQSTMSLHRQYQASTLPSTRSSQRLTELLMYQYDRNWQCMQHEHVPAQYNDVQTKLIPHHCRHHRRTDSRCTPCSDCCKRQWQSAIRRQVYLTCQGICVSVGCTCSLARALQALMKAVMSNSPRLPSRSELCSPPHQYRRRAGWSAPSP